MTNCPVHGIMVNQVCCNRSRSMPKPGIPRTKKAARSDHDLKEMREEARKHVDDNTVGYWARMVLELLDHIENEGR